METLFIIACVANPLRWQSRIALARAAVADWLKEPNVHITLAECAYGSGAYNLADLASARVDHIPLRATTVAWSKECLLNIAIAHLPPAAEKIAALDADITFRRAGWATEALAALDLYPVIQPWDTAYDLGPHDEHVQTHKSFASVWHAGKPVVATSSGFWAFNGGYYAYPHPGYAWGWQRRVLDRIGGLLEIGAMGSGDYHMALGIVGHYEASMPVGVSEGYKNSIASWATRAAFEVNGKVGFVHARSSTRSTAARATAAIRLAGKCSSTAVSIRRPISSATPMACSNSPALSPTSSAPSTDTSARARKT
jgi:hypothetical protein